MSRPPVLLATRSAGKLRELRPLFEAARIPVMDLEELGVTYDADEGAIERFTTYEANAVAKAHYFYEVTGGIATVADDSGLEVVALGGAPGVRSKRWAAESGALAGGDDDAANNALLERSMAGLTDRRGRYVCVAAYVGLGREVACRGEVEGEILAMPRGAGGFGYDPYFLAPELGRTFAEATLEEKAGVSHRSRAFRALMAAIASDGGPRLA
jgi:XTP/dITP diphosphohydrolase